MGNRDRIRSRAFGYGDCYGIGFTLGRVLFFLRFGGTLPIEYIAGGFFSSISDSGDIAQVDGLIIYGSNYQILGIFTRSNEALSAD